MNDMPFNSERFKGWLAVLGLVGAGFHFVWGWLGPFLVERSFRREWRIKKARAQAEHRQTN